MKPEDIAAYIGAAAWLPQIGYWIYRYFSKSKLLIIPDQFVEIGFTCLGPLFNVRMAFSVENQDLIIDGIRLKVRHQDGDERIFSWASLSETISEITDLSGNTQFVTRDQSPIAIKIVQQSLLERFVRFHLPKYHKQDQALVQNLIAQLNFLKQQKPQSHFSDSLLSKECFALIQHRENAFWWKQGKYEVSVFPSSPQKFELINSSFAFELHPVDINLIQQNIEWIKTDIKNCISPNEAKNNNTKIDWRWCNVTIIKP